MPTKSLVSIWYIADSVSMQTMGDSFGCLAGVWNVWEGKRELNNYYLKTSIIFA